MIKTNWLTNADPSWYPRVLATLQRDYPQIAKQVWGTAIAENAEERMKELNAQLGAYDMAPGHGGWGG